GLVVPIDVPRNITHAEAYPTAPCSVGRFWLVRPAVVGITVCPNGQPLLFGKCFQPGISDLTGKPITFNCIARNVPVQGFRGIGLNGRAYNLYVKAVDGSYRKDANGRFIAGAFYRLHVTKTVAVGQPTCLQDDAPSQIGCLARANGCAIGYAARDADTLGPT